VPARARARAKTVKTIESPFASCYSICPFIFATHSLTQNDNMRLIAHSTDDHCGAGPSLRRRIYILYIYLHRIMIYFIFESRDMGFPGTNYYHYYVRRWPTSLKLLMMTTVMFVLAENMRIPSLAQIDNVMGQSAILHYIKFVCMLVCVRQNVYLS
jgi:hypothetical protein